jgi:hypothetical protein
VRALREKRSRSSISHINTTCTAVNKFSRVCQTFLGHTPTAGYTNVRRPYISRLPIHRIWGGGHAKTLAQRIKNDAARSPQAPSSSRRVNRQHLSPKVLRYRKPRSGGRAVKRPGCDVSRTRSGADLFRAKRPRYLMASIVFDKCRFETTRSRTATLPAGNN